MDILSRDDLADLNTTVLPYATTLVEDGKFWNPQRTGHPETDHEAGISFARMASKQAHEFGSPELLGHILRDLMAGGHLGDVEIGFLSVIASRAYCGALN